MNNNFLLVNFPQGAGGKFLSSLLMASPSIAHFDPLIEKNKNVTTCLDYVCRSFTSNKQQWILTEPNHVDAWNLHFISSKYARGDNLSATEFSTLCKEHGTVHFRAMIAQGKKILIPWHKTYIPNFFEHAQKITILLDTQSEPWFNNALWEKHYTVENNKIKLNVHDPTLNPKLLSYFAKFDNNMYSVEPIDQFYKTHIVDNPDKQLFGSANMFVNRKNNLFISLYDLLHGPYLVTAIQQICKEFNLEPIDSTFILSAQTHWRGLHDY